MTRSERVLSAILAVQAALSASVALIVRSVLGLSLVSVALSLIAVFVVYFVLTLLLHTVPYRSHRLRRLILGPDDVIGTWVDVVQEATGEVTVGHLKLSVDGSGISGVGTNYDVSGGHEFKFARGYVARSVLLMGYEYNSPDKGRLPGLARLAFGSPSKASRRRYEGRFGPNDALSSSNAVMLTPDQEARYQGAEDDITRLALLKQFLRSAGVNLWNQVEWKDLESDRFIAYRDLTGETQRIAADVRTIIEASFPGRTNLRLLDYGRGSGWVSALLSDVVATTVGIDRGAAEDEWVLTIESRNKATEAQTVRAVDTPFERVGAAGPYDVLLFSHVLAYVQHPLALIKKLAETGAMTSDALWLVILPDESSIQMAIGKRAGELKLIKDPGRVDGDHAAVLKRMLEADVKQVQEKKSRVTPQVDGDHLRVAVEFWLGKLLPSLPIELVKDVVERDGDKYILPIVSDIIYWRGPR